MNIQKAKNILYFRAFYSLKICVRCTISTNQNVLFYEQFTDSLQRERNVGSHFAKRMTKSVKVSLGLSFPRLNRFEFGIISEMATKLNSFRVLRRSSRV